MRALPPMALCGTDPDAVKSEDLFRVMRSDTVPLAFLAVEMFSAVNAIGLATRVAGGDGT